LVNFVPTPPTPWHEAQDCSKMACPAAAPVRTGAADAAGAEDAPDEEHAPRATARIAPASGVAIIQRERDRPIVLSNICCPHLRRIAAMTPSGNGSAPGPVGPAEARRIAPDVPGA
jgi:hypothetical protein